MQALQQFFEENDRFAKLLGFQIEEFNVGVAKVSVLIKEEHLNAANVVHGGFLFSLADYAFALASNSHNKLSLAISANIMFQHAKPNGKLYAYAKELSIGNKIATYEVQISDEKDSVVATYTGTVYRKDNNVI
jgi:acyl-CoA thioesterase